MKAALKRRLLEAIEGEDKGSGAEIKALSDALYTLAWKTRAEEREDGPAIKVQFVNTEGAEE